MPVGMRVQISDYFIDAQHLFPFKDAWRFILIAKMFKFKPNGYRKIQNLEIIMKDRTLDIWETVLRNIVESDFIH